MEKSDKLKIYKSLAENKNIPSMDSAIRANDGLKPFGNM